MRMPLFSPRASEPEWIRIALRSTHLLSLRFNEDILTQSLEGTHWISWEGRDLFIEQGQMLRLTPGMALVNGVGIMQIALLPKAEHPITKFGRWLLTKVAANRSKALQIRVQ
ncbi:hypothetical protein [Pseudomonas sp. TE3610]